MSKTLTEAQQKQLLHHFLEHVYSGTREALAPLQAKIVAAEGQAEKLRAGGATSLIFKELAQPKEAFILKRGEYDQPTEKVARSTPAAFPPPPEGAPNNRLGLAQWLVADEHPLTARVAVNRFWQQVFGIGIVKTAEDFGSQGEPPSHPQLLDWLAVDFREAGWDVKRLMKQLVMSASYRQSTKVRSELFERDPENRLLSRGPRFRLDAEMLRDQALAVSGLLVKQARRAKRQTAATGRVVERGWVLGFQHGEFQAGHGPRQSLSPHAVHLLQTHGGRSADEHVRCSLA